ncbi:PuhC protein [Roseivivax marinus]|jgi:putative photosynthetic complex assembly protein|uniref:PuhC protein n=1 Tax=Roseivivax marinus TaxID=1379903 RepID=W4HJP8_9RHOB|nr:photosynthetic complex assembly protein PuhC [Roseivivax marinus]ETW12356.1 PuhC protein [Roseivivax marinus]UMA64314.1 pullulanase [Roseivivax marinus]
MSTQNADFRGSSEDLVPLPLIRALCALVVFSLVTVSWAVLTDRPLDATPPDSRVVAERVLYLDGDLAGAARITEADGTLVADLAPEEGGFISGVARVLDRERTKARVPLDGPVRLIAMENGRVAILDPSTGWRADLMGFGADNAAAFARLLPQPTE